MTNSKLLAIGGAGALAALVTGGLVSVYAQDGGTGSTTQASPDQQDHEAQRDAFLQKVADRLGVPLDTLKEALKGASLDTVDEKVASGEITEDQAARMRERIEAGDFGFGPGGPHRGHEEHGPGLGADRGELAAFLGIDEEALHDALQSGQTLAQVAEANGKSRDDLKAFLRQQAADALNQAVTDGELTQDQADQKLAGLDANLDALIDGQMPAHGPRHGMPGPSGMAPGGARFSYPGIGGAPTY
jgi:hypothetical protein